MAVLPAPIRPTSTMLRSSLGSCALLSCMSPEAYHKIDMTIDGPTEAFLEMLAAERGAARNTLAAYQADLEDFSAFLGAGASTASAAQLGAYLESLQAVGLSARTAARRLSA